LEERWERLTFDWRRMWSGTRQGDDHAQACGVGICLVGRRDASAGWCRQRYRGGWTHPYWHDDIGAHFFEAISQSDALLRGRKTWQIHGGAFEPMAEGDPFGDVMNTMPKYIVSTSLSSASAWCNSTLIKRNVVEEVRALKAQAGKNIAIDGSSVLVQSLAQHHLIDEYSCLG
jgi:dihydrofolate reductase